MSAPQLSGPSDGPCASLQATARWAALRQAGPWSGDADLSVDAIWLEDALSAKIETIDWPEASADVMRFLRPEEAKSVGLWSARFFQSRLAKLTASITGRIG